MSLRCASSHLPTGASEPSSAASARLSAHDLGGAAVRRRQAAVRKPFETGENLVSRLLLEPLPFAAGPAFVAVPQAGFDQADRARGVVEVRVGALDFGQGLGLGAGGCTPESQGGRKEYDKLAQVHAHGRRV